MTCTCGHVMSAEAESRDAAVAQIQGMMTEEAIAAHMAEKHPGDAIPTVADIHAQIAEMTEPKM